MGLKTSRYPSWNRIRQALVVPCCAALLLPGGSLVLAQEKTEAPQPSPTTAGTAEPGAAKIPAEQLEALVAPIALYPDPLLAQTLVASTYPLEIIQLQQWLGKHKDLKDKALADAVAKQPWDPSIQSMAAVPEVVKRLADDVQWTTDLGNAFLAQQGDVMDAVQRMRKKAMDKGALKSNEQQKVDTQVVEQKTVIVVQSANPEVIYVPIYSPVVVYGPPIYYPYPPIYYPPPPPPGAAFVTFTFGVMMGAAIWGGSCCHCGWGGNDVNINVNNNFNQINHNGGQGGGGNNWQHNPQHRGGAPYPNNTTANKYGGGQKGGAGNRAGGSAGAPSASDRSASGGAGKGAGAPSASDRSASGGAGKGAAGPSTSDRSASGGAGKSAGAPSASGRSASGGAASSGSKASGGFGGGSGGYSGSSAKASSSRGASSMGSRGGGSRGGGGGGRRR